MVAAAKRGRPRKLAVVAYEIMASGNSQRADLNQIYATQFIKEIKADNEMFNFFVSPKGKLLHLGIAEQLGRMLECGAMVVEDLHGAAQDCIKLYNEGYSVKEIEKHLRRIRLDYMSQA